MADRDPKSAAGAFTRGAEIFSHKAKMLSLAVLWVGLISIFAGVVAGGYYFYKASTSEVRTGIIEHSEASIRSSLNLSNDEVTIHNGGYEFKLPANKALVATESYAMEGARLLRNSLIIAAISAAIVIIGMVAFLTTYGHNKMVDKRLRGASQVTGPELAELMAINNDCSPYTLAGVPIRKGAENLHLLIAGAQGTGKSQLFFDLMDQTRTRKKKCIVYDPTGEYVATYFREGKDIIMNPLDARSPNWNIWTEIQKDYHFMNMANGLIPDPADADPFWAKAGRIVLQDLYRVLGRDGKRTNRDLYEAIAKNALSGLEALLQGEAGATFVARETERTGMSIKMTVLNQLESFRFLHDSGPLFSIRKWFQSEDDSWMFITGREEQRQVLAPILSLWVDIAIKAVLSMPPVHRERFWFFLDETPTLQKLDILKLAVTNTRKYGLCMVLGVQDFPQLYEIYGHDLARTIISGCQTKCILRVTDGAAAKLICEGLGQSEVDEKEENTSFGAGSNRDGITVYSKRTLRDIVMSSEILTLPDMTGYLTTPGPYPIARVSYGYKPRKTVAEGWIERQSLSTPYPQPASAKPCDGTLVIPNDLIFSGEQDSEIASADTTDNRVEPHIGTPRSASMETGAENKRPGPLSDAL